jgi:hypothetical protein
MRRTNCVRFLFVALDKQRSVQREVNTPDESLARTLMLLSAQRNAKINSDEQHAIFTHELHSALRLTVGFSNIYCEPQQICHFCLSNVYLKH